MEKQSISKVTLAIATGLSGMLLYFAIGISGNYGFLLWLAPLPLIIVSFQSTGRVTFLCAFIAGLIGRLSWVPFLLVLMPPIPVIVITVLPAALFGFYLFLNQWIVLKSQSVWAVFAYPVIVTAFEFIVFNNPVDGTAGSMAYTQSNYLAVIQIASITGIWGIVFITSLLPAAVALVWYFKDNRGKQKLTLAMSSVVLFGVIVFGMIRQHTTPSHTEVTVGITAVSEVLYGDMSQPGRAQEQIIKSYVEQISTLAKQGATYVLFPEKVIQVPVSKKDSLLSVLKLSAAQSNVTIIGGLAVKKDSTRQNLVEFISSDGTVQEYKKRFHVKNFERNFERGTKVGMLEGTPFAGGMAICKDMDFPPWLRNYQHVDLLFVPAWDFVQDGWLHSRMAVLRGVENGYTIVRAGRQGRLTVSDYRGKIIAEANCEKGAATYLLAQVPVYHVDTLYSTWGDWFGWLCIFLAVVFVVCRFIVE